PARVLDDELHAPEVVADGRGLERADGETRRREPELHEPIAVRRDFLLELVEGHVVEVADHVEAADLDLPELRVVVGLPLHEALAAPPRVAVFQELQLVLDRMEAPEPGGLERVREVDAGGLQRIPELGDERVDAAPVVEPAERARAEALLVRAAPELE